MASILDQLDRLGDQHPHKLLYSYIDLNGNPIECYSYASFIHRTKAIAGHLLKDGQFVAEDRLVLAYPPGLEMKRDILERSMRAIPAADILQVDERHRCILSGIVERLCLA